MTESYQLSMDAFSGIEAFVASAEEDSFRAAAERLGVTPAAVSKAVSRLEDDLEVRLFDRTTRSIALTKEGQLYLTHCRRAVHEMYLARERIEQTRALIDGELVVALSTVLGSTLIDHLAGFSELYPGLRLRLEFGDRHSQLVQDRIDVALRIGALVDSGLVAIKLADLSWTTVASPHYLHRRGHPETLDALRQHDCLVYRSTRGKNVPWTFTEPTDAQRECSFVPAPYLTSNDGPSLIRAAKNGLGICQVFGELVAEDLEQGRLTEVLRDWASPGPPLHALVKNGRRTPKVRAFLDFVRSRMRADKSAS